MTDSRIILDYLIEYRQAMDAHLRQLTDDYSRLDHEWRNFSVVFEGDGARQFHEHWLRTMTFFKDYSERALRVLSMLDARIEYLRQVNRRDVDQP